MNALILDRMLRSRKGADCHGPSQFFRCGFSYIWIGLKSSGANGKAEMIGFFPIISQSSEQAVLGFDDTHLDFRIVVDVHQAGELAQRVSVTTLVRRKILLGKIYIAVITPFHRLIVRTMLARLARPGMVMR